MMTAKTSPADGTEIVRLAIEWRNLDIPFTSVGDMLPSEQFDQMQAEWNTAYEAFLAALDTRLEVQQA